VSDRAAKQARRAKRKAKRRPRRVCQRCNRYLTLDTAVVMGNPGNERYYCRSCGLPPRVADAVTA
jgi:late competence protein required for DNA uptake (superfamily II DNA/RNA helicase)